jgi:hypothetical protein
MWCDVEMKSDVCLTAKKGGRGKMRRQREEMGRGEGKRRRRNLSSLFVFSPFS